MPEVRLQGPRIVPLVGQREAAGVPEHMGVSREAEPAASPARSTSLAKPDVENGEPRSEVNTNGDFGSCSRCSFLNARISSPRNRMGRRGALFDPANMQTAHDQSRSDPNGGPPARSPAGRAGRRPGSWWRRDAPSGSSQLP